MLHLPLILLPSLWCKQGLELWTFKNKIGKKTASILEGCRRGKIPNKGHIYSSNICEISYIPIILSRKQLHFISTGKVITQLPFLVCQIVYRYGNNREASRWRGLKGEWSYIHYWVSDRKNQMHKDFFGNQYWHSQCIISLQRCWRKKVSYWSSLFFSFSLVKKDDVYFTIVSE